MLGVLLGIQLGVKLMLELRFYRRGRKTTPSDETDDEKRDGQADASSTVIIDNAIFSRLPTSHPSSVVLLTSVEQSRLNCSTHIHPSTHLRKQTPTLWHRQAQHLGRRLQRSVDAAMYAVHGPAFSAQGHLGSDRVRTLF